MGLASLYWLLARLIDRKAGLYGAIVLATMPLYFMQARTMLGDIVTMAVLGGFLVAVYIGWFSDAAKARQRMDECEAGLRLSFLVFPIVKYAMPLVLAVLLFFAFMGTPCPLSGYDADAGLIEEIVRLFGGRFSGTGCRG